MEENLTRDPRYAEAVRHARAVRGFYTHAAIYALVNLGLLAVNAVGSPGRWWVAGPILGWGIGLAAHGLGVFAFGGWLGREWEERKVREYLRRHP